MTVERSRYNTFLFDIKKTTMQLVLDSLNSDTKDNHDVKWKMVGVEFRKSEVIRNYGKSVYDIADKEVYYSTDEKRRIFREDDENKLGCIIHEFVSASPLIDIGYMIKLFNENGIPCYIDYETNTFHYNAEVKKKVLN